MRYYQGTYRPKFPRKYKGNPHNITYRSSWEYKFMLWCDTTPSIQEWSSEECVIPYKSPVDNKYHRYFVDFYMKINNKKYLVEVKPFKQTKEPKTQKRMTKKYINEVVTWSVNQAKWKAATEFCLDRQWEFKIITEKELKV
jgi:hypothetical protein